MRTRAPKLWEAALTLALLVPTFSAAENTHTDRGNNVNGRPTQATPPSGMPWPPRQMSLRTRDFCTNPYSICEGYTQASQGKPSFVAKTVDPARYPEYVRQMEARVQNFFQTYLKSAMKQAIAEQPNLSDADRNRGYSSVNAIRLTFTSDRAACQGVNTINAFAQVGANNISICRGMLFNAIQNSLRTGRPLEGFLSHVLGHEVGHFLEARMSPNANQTVGRCIGSGYSNPGTTPHYMGGRGYSQDVCEGICDHWANQMFAKLYQGYAGYPEQYYDAMKDGYSNFCVFARQGYSGHAPPPERIEHGRYSPMGLLAGCTVDTDRKAYCSFAGPQYRALPRNGSYYP